MKNHWTHFFGGSVKVAITGKGIERFINECVRRNIIVWEVRKQGSHTLSFSMYLKDISKIRPIVRKSDCKLRFIERKGLPFLIRKTVLNSGFLIGAVGFFVIIILLSNMVWGIKVDGAKPETEHLILKELKRMGIEKGKLQFFLEDVESIQRHLTDNINDITWIGVELNGTTYHLEVVEKNQPEPAEHLSPRNIIAKKNAIITRMFVEEGKPLVTEHDYVNKGDILVSGKIGKEGEEKLVPARGKIFGETWYKYTLEVHLSTKLNVFTGDSNHKHYLQFGDLALPIWGFKKNEYQEFETEKYKHNVKFFKWELPIAYSKKVIRESEEVERKYSVDQAIKEAVKDGRKKLENELDNDAEIIGEKVLRHSVKNGKVKVEIKYDVIENIVSTIPLVQGD
ncbi:sporulation protein YqfD [Ferdinandcohnia quinoae]|uniref:Sporulation protein YqfD n=1 Tax=Fredinandcohnia quinoae TaxID=2918902 RepID=A0AAW5E763_9BACI|nr:sporulation protein YqfD [Fredinandcohnia sp. SECRCQ15]MCH1624978.1 sporulation protein YqfD [Fredinandcohnia sp. SECRCQ15]